MGKTIIADPSKIRVASDRMSELSQTYSSISKQLMNNASTMGEAWQGEDNLAFVNQVSGFAEDLQNMAQKLQQGAEILMQQANNYTNRQESIISATKGLAN